MIRRSTLESRSNRPVEHQAPTPSKLFFARALRTMLPTLIALSFASAAHAQGTMDFSGAQTLMGTFKTFAMYAGAVICLGGLIFAGIRMMASGKLGEYAADLKKGAHIFVEGEKRTREYAWRLLDALQKVR